MSGRLLTASEAAQWANVSVSYLNQQRMASGGKGPRFVRLGRAVRYRLEDLEAWSASLTPDGSARTDQAGAQ
ncbi:MAG: hypothetical protein JWO33_1001 [Caulobacteraceae bacterium]|nr:hypothetical protein [Caulobacteraceae bacterium]